MFEQVFLAALDHLLGGANWAQARLKPFAGRRARIEMPPLVFAFEITPHGRLQRNPDPAVTDVTIRLPADTPFLLPQGLDKVMAGALVDGNAEFATELSFVFRQLRWDAEEDLSRVIGDIPAHRLMQGGKHLFTWQKRAASNFAENLSEYLTHENPLLLSSQEFNAFRADITRLDAELARLEIRAKLFA